VAFIQKFIQKSGDRRRTSAVRPAESRTSAIGRKTSEQRPKAVRATKSGLTSWKSPPKYTSRTAASPAKASERRKPVTARLRRDS
jgi:hypothetical protein